MKAGTVGALLLVSALACPWQAAGAVDAIDGVWGYVDAAGRARCAGTAVLVFRDGKFARILPGLGTLSGVRTHVIGTSTYTLSGDRLTVAPVHSLNAPEPRRSYLLRRGAEPELVSEGESAAVLKPCPGLDARRLIP